MRFYLKVIIVGSFIIPFQSCTEKEQVMDTSQFVNENAAISTQSQSVVKSTSNKTLIINHTGDCSLVNEGDTYTSITTGNDGSIYSAWIDKDLGMRVLQIKSDGSKSEVVVRKNIQEDNYHVKPAIAVDKDGRIHVAGDMHNDAWVWYRSNIANDIKSGFLQLIPPGNGITYPQFFKDKNNELYVTFRHKVKDAPNQWTQGSNGGGIIKYQTDGTFVLLGGENHGLQKTLVWSETDGAGTARNYQKPSLRLFFDVNNRMHLVCNLINEDAPETSNINTHVLYAYSDDGGKTWKKLGGVNITKLPMTVTTMSTLVYRSQNDIVAGSHIGADLNGNPIVGWIDGTGNHLRRFNGKEWTNILPEGGSPSEFYMSRNGEICVMRPYQGVYISNDNGANYAKYNFSPNIANVAPNNQIFDREFYIQTGSIRFQYMNGLKTSCVTATLTR
jgi:hypothetical protein